MIVAGAVQYSLIAATADDRDWLDQLRRDAYRDLFDATWGGWDEQRHQAHFAASIAQGNITIIEHHGRRVGMLQLLDHGEVLEVGEIQIQPVTQRAGLGTVVLNDVIQRAKALGQTVRLSTGLKNDRALRWYLRLGFSITATSATHCYLEI